MGVMKGHLSERGGGCKRDFGLKSPSGGVSLGKGKKNC